ncbi:MAG: flagellar basal body rod protein FlgB [Nevskiaceae bacterium]|nr:MAG: flagellar basal body rod protein FlgB [Nevskiaceae bacterium]
MTDSLFDVHAAALQFHRQRMELLASNIANADTPGYQARDLDFNKVLAQVEKTAAAGTLDTTQPGHIAGPAIDDTSLKAATIYRMPTQPSADGNTVDVQTEQAAYADAALHYQASLSFLDFRLKSLMTAVTGS